MAALPQPWKALSARIYKIEEAVKRLQNASPFAGTPIRPREDGGINSTNFDGDLNAGNPGTKGWAMDDDQAAFGELLLRDGIVGNAALTNPLVPAVAHDDADGFSVAGPGWGTIMSVTVPVPTGFTQALILNLTVNASAINSTGATGWLYCQPIIPGFPGLGWSIGSPDTPAGATAVSSDTQTRLLTGLSGSFTINGQVTTNSASSWAANPVNVANLYASIVFLR